MAAPGDAVRRVGLAGKAPQAGGTPAVALKAGSSNPATPATFPDLQQDTDAPWHRMVDELAARPERVREEALRRARACLVIKRLVDGGMPARAAMQAAAQETGVPAGTLARWWWGYGALAGVQHAPVAAWPALLAPRWGVQPQREAEISGPAWDAILKDYLRPEKPALTAVYRRVKAAAARHGWAMPSYDSVARRIARLDPRLKLLAREGKKAFEASFPAQKRSVAHLAALEWVNADGHRLDVLVRLPDRFGGGVGRAHLVAWQDVYSRKILSWRLTPTLNALSVLLAFGEMVERYGIPEHALMDNGREFGAKLITGGVPWRFRFKTQPDEMLGALPLLGIEVHWATPFHGQAKPIERAFRDLCEEVAKDPRLAGAYTGNKPDAKPENYGSSPCEWQLLEQVVAEAIARHNAREGRRTETARGRSFDATFAESYARRVVTRLSKSQRAMLLLAAEPATVRPDASIEVCGNRYGLGEFGAALVGQKVVARFDPDDLAKPCHVFGLDGRYHGTADCRVRRFDDQAAAQADKRWRAAARRAARERLKYLEKVERVLPQAAGEAAVEPAAVRLFQAGALAARRPEEDARIDEMVARTDALILEMARRQLAG
ncbi:transposase domain-containing protein [Pseudothauera hydrothermalis]|uniref:transposase domain-containing protein n=1 Tax=Pseudothauera hydrothermalis TaxID=2184083 RepID=UPI0013C32670|nr:transposase domain-containing protein [Pseudothauera hydrothermalis]